MEHHSIIARENSLQTRQHLQPPLQARNGSQEINAMQGCCGDYIHVFSIITASSEPVKARKMGFQPKSLLVGLWQHVLCAHFVAALSSKAPFECLHALLVCSPRKTSKGSVQDLSSQEPLRPVFPCCLERRLNFISELGNTDSTSILRAQHL